MKICLLFLLLLSATVLAQSESTVKPKSLELANNQFAVDLWNQLSKKNDEKPDPENLFFSPYSISTALSMVYVGTNQNTATELNSTLRLGLADISDKSALAEEIRKSSEKLFGQSDTKKAYNLTSANALALDNRFTVLDSYKKTIVEKFLGELFSVDFAKDSAAATEKINKWISDKTNNKIEKMFPEPLEQTTVMALFNAVYFKGNWKSSFDFLDTYQAPFYGINGKQYQNVSFMSKTAKFNYTNSQEANLEMLELPYEGDDVSLYVFLPKSNATGDFKQMKKHLNSSFIEKLIDETHQAKITVLFPKFTLESKFELIPTLKSMGVNDLFKEKADFTGLTEQNNIAVSSIRHQSKIEVNEKGSEAAAVTTIQFVLKTYSPTSVTYFNQPFVFVIRHNGNGQLLFVGEVCKF